MLSARERLFARLLILAIRLESIQPPLPEGLPRGPRQRTRVQRTASAVHGRGCAAASVQKYGVPPVAGPPPARQGGVLLRSLRPPYRDGARTCWGALARRSLVLCRRMCAARRGGRSASANGWWSLRNGRQSCWWKLRRTRLIAVVLCRAGAGAMRMRVRPPGAKQRAPRSRDGWRVNGAPP